MDQEKLKARVAFILVGGHILLIIILVFWTSRHIEIPELVRILISLAPVSATYLVAVVKNAIKNRYRKPVFIYLSLMFSSISLSLFAFFIAMQLFFCLAYPNELAKDPGALAEWITAIEIALGGTLGLLVDALFLDDLSTPTSDSVTTPSDN